MEWKAGKLTKAVIKSGLGGNCRVRYAGTITSGTAKIDPAKGENPNVFYFTAKSPDLIKGGENVAQLQNLELKDTNVYDFPTDKGKNYELICR